MSGPQWTSKTVSGHYNKTLETGTGYKVFITASLFFLTVHRAFSRPGKVNCAIKKVKSMKAGNWKIKEGSSRTGMNVDVRSRSVGHLAGLLQCLQPCLQPAKWERLWTWRRNMRLSLIFIFFWPDQTKTLRLHYAWAFYWTEQGQYNIFLKKPDPKWSRGLPLDGIFNIQMARKKK